MTKLRIAKIVHNSLVDGPGRRTVLFLQGCQIRCPGCQNRHLWDAEGGREMDVEDAVTLVLEHGLPLTVSGGEPFDQAEALAHFLAIYRLQEPDKEIVLYSGHTYESLRLAAPSVPVLVDVLACTDILVDGPYMQQLDSDRIQWRGSSNQRAIDISQTLYTVYNRAIGSRILLGDPVTLDWDTPTITVDGEGEILASAGLMADVFDGEPSEPARMCGQTKGGVS